MEQIIILNRLLDKYESSMHLTKPGVSTRRVMLRVDKKELPEYQYEKADTRDRFNIAAAALETQGIVSTQRITGKPIIQSIVLLLDSVEVAYKVAGRIHPARLAKHFCSLLEKALSDIKSPWIAQWGRTLGEQMEISMKTPPFCKKGDEYFLGLLRALKRYDRLEGSVSMRAFSIACYSDSKRFEKDYKDEFLRIAHAHHPELSELCAQRELAWKEQLDLLGIHPRPELYELTGQFSVETDCGKTDFSALPGGAAIPSTAAKHIQSFTLYGVDKVVFIENKTCYDEYLISERQANELVVYHGGFLSPQKRKFVEKLSSAAREHVRFYFWADIDLGGFQMFARLKQLVPSLEPLRMTSREVDAFSRIGLKRSKEYLCRLALSLEHNEFPIFEDALKMILHHGVTIEQEALLKLERDLN